MKPRLTQHLHRALLQPSNVQEVHRDSSIEQPTCRVEEEDGERSLEARLFWIYCVLLVSVEYVSIFQDVRWCPKIPNWDHIVTVKSQDFTVGQFWMELTWPSSISEIYESKCPQKKLKRAQLASEILCLCFIWDFSFSHLKPQTLVTSYLRYLIPQVSHTSGTSYPWLWSQSATQGWG